jgi:DNA-binding Xre family transcriptional regulator
MASSRGDYVTNRLAEVMAERKYSGVKLSKELGVSEFAIGRWKNNYKRIGDDNLAALCFLFKLHPEDIVQLDFTEFKQKYKLPDFNNDKIQISDNPGKRKDKGDGG